jgi:cytoskeletal protein RodZ
MWWIIGTLIGIASNLHDEKKNPELRAKREKEARQGYLGCLIVLALLVVATVVVLVVGNDELNPTAPAQTSSASHSSAVETAPIPAPVASTTSAVPEVLPSPKATTPIPASEASTPVSLPDALPAPKQATLTEASYQGTVDTNFAKDWVIVDGKKIEGITLANPAPNAQVAILYSDGGKNVPASSLPQGFLNAWQLTPEKLKAAGNQ